MLVCTHATFRFAVEELGIAAFDQRLLAIDEFHHVSSNPDNKLGSQLGELMARDKVHLVAMTGSYFRGDSEAVLAPGDEARFETVTYTYYEQLNGYQWLKSLDIGYFFYTGPYVDAVAKVLNPALKTIVHIPNVNARESLKDKQREVDEIMNGLGEWKGVDPATGFHLVQTLDGRTLRVADLVDDSDPARRSRVLGALKDPAQKENRDNVDVIIALGMAKEGATRICKEDLNEVVTSFLQDKTTLERGLFDQENTLPEELTQLRMGKIVRERYPDLSDVDQEAVRQHAIAAMNITQQAKLALARLDADGGGAIQGSTALLDGVRKFVNVRDLDIDLIDRINPFDAAYAVLAKAMDEKSLRQVQASIAAKKLNIPEDEARDLAKRALLFKQERGRLPEINAADPWEKRMAEGVAAFARYRAQAKAANQGE